MSPNRVTSLRRPLAWLPRASAGAVALALALGLADAAPARADLMVALGAGRTTVENSDRDFSGFGLEFVAGPKAHPLAWQTTVDIVRSPRATTASVTMGLRLGTVRGPVRPYFDGFFGLSNGEATTGGFLVGYGAGATVPLDRRFGLFVDVCGYQANSFEDSAHMIQWRAGLTLRRAAYETPGAGR